MLPLIIAIVGLVIYILVNPNPPSIRATRFVEVGRIMLWTGLLAFLLTDTGAVGTAIGRHIH